MWSKFLAISCLHIVPCFSSTPLNNNTLFANAEWCSVLVLGWSNELNEPVCVCVCVYVCWGGKSEQLSFQLSTGGSLLTCSLYWITSTLIVSSNVSLVILIAAQLHRISSLHLIYVDTECKTRVPLHQLPVSTQSWPRHLISRCYSETVQGSKVEDFNYYGQPVRVNAFHCLIGPFPANLKTSTLYRLLTV